MAITFDISVVRDVNYIEKLELKIEAETIDEAEEIARRVSLDFPSPTERITGIRLIERDNVDATVLHLEVTHYCDHNPQVA